MKRYTAYHTFESMDQEDDGPWVRYEDAQAEIERLMAKVETITENAKHQLSAQMAEIERLRQHNAEQAEIEYWEKLALDYGEVATKQAATIFQHQSRIKAMYEALVASGSINRIPEAHEWVGK